MIYPTAKLTGAALAALNTAPLAQQAMPETPAPFPTELGVIHERLAQLVDVTRSVPRRLAGINERAYGKMTAGSQVEPRPERTGVLGNIHELLDELDTLLTVAGSELDRVEGLV